MNEYTNVDKCRICSSDSIEVLKFDPQYIATTFVTNNDEHPMSQVKIQ